MRRKAGCQMTYPQLLLADSIAERTNLISLFPVLVVMEVEMMMMTHMNGHHIFRLFWLTLSQKEPISSVSTHSCVGGDGNDEDEWWCHVQTSWCSSSVLIIACWLHHKRQSHNLIQTIGQKCQNEYCILTWKITTLFKSSLKSKLMAVMMITMVVSSDCSGQRVSQKEPIPSVSNTHVMLMKVHNVWMRNTLAQFGEILLAN